MNEYELSSVQQATPRVSVEDLADRTPRVLLRGYDVERRDFVVTLTADGFKREAEGTTTTAPEWAAIELAPNKRIFPEPTDFEFASLLVNRGVSLTFLPFGHFQEIA